MGIVLNDRYESPDVRRDIIKKIMDVKYGINAFSYYLERFYIPRGSEDISLEAKKMLFVDYKMLNKVIQLFCSFCPELNYKIPAGKNKTISKKKLDLVKKALDVLDWNSLNNSIYETLETKGDAFFYIYFDENEIEAHKKDEKVMVIPRLKVLESEKMNGIAINGASEPVAYIYKERIFDEVIDYVDGIINVQNERDVVLVFETGKVTKTVMGVKTNGLPVKDKDGNIKFTETLNRDSYKDLIPVIHVPSQKSKSDRFSIIPSEDYVDLTLQITQILSDIRQVNRQLGFPRTVLVDCKFVEGDGRIGGVRVAESYGDYQGQVVELSLKGEQKSTFKELEIALDNLYDTVGLTSPTMMLRVGSSDSSKVYQQANNRMETKINKYVNNILEAFKVYFKILFMENGVYDESLDLDYTFEKPKSIIKISQYDELLNSQLELNTGLSTIHQKLRELGFTEEQIKKHMGELNLEILNGKNDISIKEKIDKVEEMKEEVEV